MSREQTVRDVAYAIWEAEGKPLGRDAQHWRLAEERVAASLTGGLKGMAKTVKAAPDKASSDKASSKPAAAKAKGPAKAATSPTEAATPSKASESPVSKASPAVKPAPKAKA